MREDKRLFHRITDPILQVLQSRRVVIVLSALIVALLVMAVPELAEVREELLTLVITLALAIIGGYSISDAARAARLRNGNNNGNGASPEELRRLVKELLIELIDEVGEEQPDGSERLAEAPKEQVNV